MSDAEDPGDWDAIEAVQNEALRIGGMLSVAVQADRDRQEAERDAEYKAKTEARRVDALKVEEERNARYATRDQAIREQRAKDEAERDAKYEARGKEIAASRQRSESSRITQMQQIIDDLEARLAAARSGSRAPSGGGRQTPRVAPVRDLQYERFDLSPEELAELEERRRKAEEEKRKGRRR